MTAEIHNLPASIKEADDRNSKELFESAEYAIQYIGGEIEALFLRKTHELMSYKFTDEQGRTQGISCMLAQWIKHLEFARQRIDARWRVEQQ